ncbi:MAG: hypothetical protein JSW06_08080 [Thermoplasmatales archaeon]|nr:MAG: hypothetical protein JSW06_08080 [Thermoplasmatales archaeon]
MNIAGTTSDTEESEEIEDIVKIFLISQRMKNLSYQRKQQRKSRKIPIKNFEKITEYHNFKPGQFSLFSARGLN